MDMIQTFRIMKGIGDLEASDFKKLSFSHRVVDDWNALPRKVVEARDVELDKAFFAPCPISLRNLFFHDWREIGVDGSEFGIEPLLKIERITTA